MKSSQLIRFGNLTLVFGLLATTVGASLLFLPDTADAAPQFGDFQSVAQEPAALHHYTGGMGKPDHRARHRACLPRRTRHRGQDRRR